ncbi:MAG: aspartate aminotransferase family protein [Phycisphaerae bacterium]|nr:aspartate aminotransferase family protein [Phycisphaerae bacterium]
MTEQANSSLAAKIDRLNRNFFIGEDGTNYGGYYDYCMKFLHMVDQLQENRVPEIDMSGIDKGMKVPRTGTLKSAGATLLPFYEGPYFRGGLDWRNVLPGSAVPGIIFAQASKITNSNLATCKYGGRASELEVRMSATMASLVGFDSTKSAGIFTEAGTKANLYGYTLGLRKAIPDVARTGIVGLKNKICFINSQAGHFSNLTNLALMGVGTDNVISIPADENTSIDLAVLEETLEKLHSEGTIVPTILLTAGTTDTFGVDDVKAVSEMRDRIFADCSYSPHIHVDAAIGWAMIFFNDYNFDENIHDFDEWTLSALRSRQELFRNLRYGNSITLDFHKTGYAPYNSSMVLIRDREDLAALRWQADFFRYFNPEEMEIAPVQYTFECTRNPDTVFSIAGNILSLGVEGYQLCLGWVIQVSNYLRRRLMDLKHVGVVNPANNGFSTVFRVYPIGVDGQAELQRELSDPDYRSKFDSNTDYTKGLFDFRNRRQTTDDPKLDWISAGSWLEYDRSVEVPAWKAYLLNPRVLYEDVDRFIEDIEKLDRKYEATMGGIKI